ncbi:MAG: hypothetical protein J5833_07175 [Victivallales bacterium]|nr:hypothetical protein [Victivallales bacterium]
MDIKTTTSHSTTSGAKTAYEPPELVEIVFASGFPIKGDSNIIDDEDHEYDPDNDD